MTLTVKSGSNSDFSFLPMSPVSSLKDQSKPPKSLLVGGQCLDTVMSCLKPFDLNERSQFEAEEIFNAS